MEALKTAPHIIDHVLSKSVPKIPYELLIGRKPSITYLQMWGFPSFAKIFNQQLGKLDPKTVSYHFIGYPKKSKGYRFVQNVPQNLLTQGTTCFWNVM
jgi:hypothetical protein